jgi:hypothetical protein
MTQLYKLSLNSNAVPDVSAEALKNFFGYTSRKQTDYTRNCPDGLLSLQIAGISSLVDTTLHLDTHRIAKKVTKPASDEL